MPIPMPNWPIHHTASKGNGSGVAMSSSLNGTLWNGDRDVASPFWGATISRGLSGWAGHPAVLNASVRSGRRCPRGAPVRWGVRGCRPRR
jgi:hypothetical protein